MQAVPPFIRRGETGGRRALNVAALPARRTVSVSGVLTATSKLPACSAKAKAHENHGVKPAAETEAGPRAAASCPCGMTRNCTRYVIVAAWVFQCTCSRRVNRARSRPRRWHRGLVPPLHTLALVEHRQPREAVGREHGVALTIEKRARGKFDDGGFFAVSRRGDDRLFERLIEQHDPARGREGRSDEQAVVSTRGDARERTHGEGARCRW